MPTSETYVIRPSELVGRMGIAVYDLIAKDTEVIVVRYDREGDCYDVSTSPL
jgi:hypothetical protein